MSTGESRTFTRSEEELSLEGRRVRTVRRVRLRKRIEEDFVDVRVPVRREVLEVIEEDLAGGDSVEGGEPLSEERFEIVLHEEVPVVETRVVPTERVLVTRYLVEEGQVIEETLRREVIDLDEENVSPTREP